MFSAHKMFLFLLFGSSVLMIYQLTISNLKFSRLKWKNVEKKGSHVQSIDGTFYMFSAFIIHTNKNDKRFYQNFDYIVDVSGWVKNNSRNNRFVCCFVLSNTTESCVSIIIKNVFHLNLPLRSADFICPFKYSASSLKYITVLAESSLRKYKDSKRSLFKHNEEHFMTVSRPETGKNHGLALCSQVTYGYHNPNHLIEWFEIHKLLGVDKVMTNTLLPNVEAMRVLEYYESEGIAIVIRGFDLPEEEKYPRDITKLSLFQTSDKQILHHQCQARFYDYQYVGLLDKDEYLIPNPQKFGFSLKSYLDSAFKKNIGAIRFLVKNHVTDWGKTNASSEFYIGQHIYGSVATIDRTKNILMPTRVRLGTMIIHEVTPHNIYKQITANPNDAVINHYRACRNDSLGYLIGNNKNFYRDEKNQTCQGIRQVYAHDVKSLIDNISLKNNIRYVKRKLSIS